MECANQADLRIHNVCCIVFLALALGPLLQGPGLVAQDQVEPLPSLQQKLIAALAKARPTVVRLVWQHEKEEESSSGVILTADGYIVTHTQELHFVPGKPVTVYIHGGRNVAGTAVGSFSPTRRISFGVAKIAEHGVWPYAETRTAKEPSSGDTCLSFGFPGEPDGSRDREPSAHVGHLIPWGAPGMLRSSCLEGFEDFGGGLFDMEGRLIGIRTVCWFSDNVGKTGLTNCYLGIKVVEQNWRDLTSRKPLGSAAAMDGAAAAAGPAQYARFPAAPSLDSPELGAVSANVRAASVALTTFQPPLGGSGTIVTADGYIATLWDALVKGPAFAAPVSVIKSSPVMSRVFVVPAAVARAVYDRWK